MVENNMPLGIVSDDDFDSELENDVVSSVSIAEKASKGRALGDVNVPESLRKIIGEDAAINGTKDAMSEGSIAHALGISPSSVSAYKRGATSSNGEAKDDILSHINRGKEKAIKRASRSMHLALSHITPDKLREVKAKDLSSIAKDMSALIKNLEPEREEAKKNVNFVFFAPRTRDIDSYRVIDVGED